MPPRFDTAKRTLDLSVADLLDATLTRSLGFANRGGYERLWLGQAIHSRYQERSLESDPTFRREVGIVHRFEHRGWQVAVQGRIDGIRREPDAFIEKIVAGWPRNFDAKRSVGLGFKAETSFEDIVRAHVEDELGGTVA